MKNTTQISLSEIRNNLKIKWYRSPVVLEILKELSQRSDFKGFLQSIGHLGLWFCTGLLTYLHFLQESWLGFTIALFLHGTIGSFFTAAQHELNHGTVFKTKWLNKMFLIVFSLLGWLNFRTYEMSHTYHHRYTLFLEGDKEEVHPKIPSLNFFYLIQLLSLNVTGGEKSKGIIPTLKNFVRLSFNNLDDPFNDWGKSLYAELSREGEKAVNWARFVLVFHVSVIIFSFLIGQPIIALLISGHCFIGNLLYYFVGTPMHCGLRTNVPDFRKCVRNMKLDPISEFLYWKMNWHLNHHMYAAVPFYNLKKLYDVIKNDLPKPKNLLETWIEMREIYSQQKIYYKYEFDTPLPSPNIEKNKDNKINDLEDSIGDLAPEVLA